MERYEESTLRGRRREERPPRPGMLGRNPAPAVGHRRVAAHQRLCERGLKSLLFFVFFFLSRACEKRSTTRVFTSGFSESSGENPHGKRWL